MKSIIILLFALLVLCSANTEFLSSNSILTGPLPAKASPTPLKTSVPDSLVSLLQNLINEKGLKDKSTCLSDGRLIVRDQKTSETAQTSVKKLKKSIKVIQCVYFLTNYAKGQVQGALKGKLPISLASLSKIRQNMQTAQLSSFAGKTPANLLDLSNNINKLQSSKTLGKDPRQQKNLLGLLERQGVLISKHLAEKLAKNGKNKHLFSVENRNTCWNHASKLVNSKSCSVNK